MASVSTEPARPAYMMAIVRALVAAGGSARPKAVYAALEANGDRRYPSLAAGVDPQLHYENAVRFARQELAEGGLIGPTPGIWALVDIEAARALTAAEAIRIIGENRRARERRRADRVTVGTDDDIVEGAGNALSFRVGTRRRQQMGPTTGPKPSRYEASFRREDGPASTYLFRFGDTDIWKIGYAGDIESRLDHVNQHVPVEIVKGCWRFIQSAHWPSQDIAYAMEQAQFRLLAPERTMFERLRCGEARMLNTWNEALLMISADMAMDTDKLALAADVAMRPVRRART